MVNSSKIGVKKVVMQGVDLNDPWLGSKKESGPLETKNHSKENTLHPDTGILTKVMYLMGFYSLGVEELTDPRTRQICDATRICKETSVGTTMIYVRKYR